MQSRIRYTAAPNMNIWATFDTFRSKKSAVHKTSRHSTGVILGQQTSYKVKSQSGQIIALDVKHSTQSSTREVAYSIIDIVEERKLYRRHSAVKFSGDIWNIWALTYAITSMSQVSFNSTNYSTGKTSTWQFRATRTFDRSLFTQHINKHPIVQRSNKHTKFGRNYLDPWQSTFDLVWAQAINKSKIDVIDTIGDAFWTRKSNR